MMLTAVTNDRQSCIYESPWYDLSITVFFVLSSNVGFYNTPS